MKNHTLMTFIKVLILCVFTSTAYAANKVKPERLIDNGTDGDERYYTVYCTDGKRTSVVNRYEIGEVCTRISGNSEEICKNWTVDEAAIASCN